MMDTCGFDNNMGNRETCIADLANLPLTEGPDLFLDTNTQGCRVLHTTLAFSRPEVHCPHISLTPLKDPQGQIKCQEPGNSFAIQDFFDETDLEWFDNYMRHRGIDPDMGLIFCEETFWCSVRDFFRRFNLPVWG